MKTLRELTADIERYKLNTACKNIGCAIRYANGCGALNSWFKPPKTILGVDIESACYLHDIDAQLSKGYAALEKANLNFKLNLIKIIKNKSNLLTYYLRRAIVQIYFLAVKHKWSDNYAESRGFIK